MKDDLVNVGTIFEYFKTYATVIDSYPGNLPESYKLVIEKNTEKAGA